MKWRLLPLDCYILLKKERVLAPLSISNHIIFVNTNASNLSLVILKHNHLTCSGNTTIILKTISALVLF